MAAAARAAVTDTIAATTIIITTATHITTATAELSSDETKWTCPPDWSNWTFELVFSFLCVDFPVLSCLQHFLA
jgi:hypothetical protein